MKQISDKLVKCLQNGKTGWNVTLFRNIFKIAKWKWNVTLILKFIMIFIAGLLSLCLLCSLCYSALDANVLNFSFYNLTWIIWIVWNRRIISISTVIDIRYANWFPHKALLYFAIYTLHCQLRTFPWGCFVQMLQTRRLLFI